MFVALDKVFTMENVLYLGKGALISLGMAILSLLIGLVLGVLGASAKRSRFFILRAIGNVYVGFMRGTPMLLQLMILYYVIFKTSTLSPIIVGILTFGINSGAYVAEIFRAGYDGIDKGQREASKTLGLNYLKTMRYIIFPQALAKIFPALGNEIITLVKETSIAGYVGIVELIKAADIISSRTYDYFFPLIIAAIVYLLLTFILSKVMKYGERKLNHVVSG